MRKVKLRMNEYHKYSIIKNLVYNGGNKKRIQIMYTLNANVLNYLRHFSKILTKKKVTFSYFVLSMS